MTSGTLGTFLPTLGTFLSLVLLVGQAQASCFGYDASWKKLAKPTVSQPSRNDPSKVLVSWDKIINNPKCVDNWNLHVIPDGMPQSTETKIHVDKKLVSSIVEVQPCVGYRFMVEFQEKETIGGGFKSSGETVFKTTATPSIPSILDKKQFKVGYQWDSVKQVSNLRMVSIKFPRDLVKHASCLDYIQVSGDQLAPGRPSLSRQSSTASMTGALSWGHLGYQPQISAGSGATTLPARIPSWGRSSVSRGSSPPRGPLAGTYSPTPSLTSQKSSSSSHGSPFGPVETPHYAGSLPRASRKGALKKSGPVKVQAPFLKPTIELLIAADANCAEYNFEVKFFAPRSKEVGKVTMLHLPSLADIPSYVPPPITAVMDIKFSTSGKPIYGVKTSSGVSAACLPSYFEALDAYRQRLENEISYKTKQTSVTQGLVTSTSLQMEEAQEAILAKQGCICTSPHIELTTTDWATSKSHADFFGHYHYKGLQGGHPYYEKMPHTHAGTHNHAGHKHQGATPTLTSNKPTPAPTTTVNKTTLKPMFLFFEPKEKMWVFGPTLGSSKGAEFGSTKNNLGKCPGDPQATAGGWSKKSSILKRWKKDAHLKVICETNL